MYLKARKSLGRVKWEFSITYLLLLGVETVAATAQTKQFEQQNVRLKEALVK